MHGGEISGAFEDMVPRRSLIPSVGSEINLRASFAWVSRPILVKNQVAVLLRAAYDYEFLAPERRDDESDDADEYHEDDYNLPEDCTTLT
jgi:hypothetical protein